MILVLMAVSFGGSAWHIDTVDNVEGVGRYTSLDLDNNGLPHISYVNRLNGNLKYAVGAE
jgi:hypothetical protein